MYALFAVGQLAYNRKKAAGYTCIKYKHYLVKDTQNNMQITGTFIDEISHDIPHQNWGAKEWEQDFQYMAAAGIDTVILIRSGYRKFITYPSAYLMDKHGCFKPPVDLVELFL